MEVWKYQLPHKDGNRPEEVEMPAGARVLSFHNQDEVPTVWALVNPKAGKVKRALRLVMTGESVRLPPDFEFVGTAPFEDGAYILHLFDLGEK